MAAVHTAIPDPFWSWMVLAFNRDWVRLVAVLILAPLLKAPGNGAVRIAKAIPDIDVRAVSTRHRMAISPISPRNLGVVGYRPVGIAQSVNSEIPTIAARRRMRWHSVLNLLNLGYRWWGCLRSP